MDDKYKSLVVVLSGFFVFCLFVPRVGAAVRLVHTPGSNACSISEVPDATYTNIQAAIDAANHDDVIRVCAGTYSERIDFHGKRLNLVSVSGRDATIIDALNAAPVASNFVVNEAVVTFNSGEGGNSILDGFTLTNGKGYATNEPFTCVGGNQCANPTPDPMGNCDGSCVNFGGTCYVGGSAMLPHKRGGGIYCSGTSPRIRNCKIEGNSANYGGGLYMDFSSPIIENCIIGGSDRATEANTSDPFSAEGDEILTNMITAAGCSPGDVSYGGEGGGMYLWHSSSASIKNNTISNNVSKNGGAGIYMYFSSPEILDNDIVDNRSYWGGGGIHCDKSSPTITNNRLLRNIARDDGTQMGSSSSITNPGGKFGGGMGKGGAILCWGSSFPTITDCDISYNGATYGGGIHCDESDPVVTNCTITHNAAWNAGRPNADTGRIDAVFAYGGGVYTYRSSPVFTRCDITNNFASVAGGGIYSENYVDYDGKDILVPVGGLPIPTLISPEVYKCTIAFNGAGVVPADLGQSGGETAVPGIPGYGGGIACQYGCSIQIQNSVIASNMVSGYGGGMATGEYYEPCTGNNASAPCWDDSDPSTNPTGWDPPNLPVSEPVITNCTIANNEKEGILADNNSRPKVVNTIIWGNVRSFGFNTSLDGSRQIDHRNNPDVSPLSYWSDKTVPVGSANVTYSNVGGGAVGVGNIDSDPLFVDNAAGNYTLKYFPLSTPPVISPSIDSGDPASVLPDDVDGAPRPTDIANVPAGVSHPQAGAFDMGAYEGCTALSTFYKDADGDTFGDPNTGMSKCVAPPGYVSNGDDCDDTDKDVNPNSKWYLDADGDGYVDETSQDAVKSQCSDPGANYYVANDPLIKRTSGDCNDADAGLNPDTFWYEDVDGDGYSSGVKVQQCEPVAGYYLDTDLSSTAVDCVDDPLVANADQINPGTIWYKDADGDGYSDGVVSDATCTRPVGYFLHVELNPLAPSGDCDDTDPLANPGTKWYLDADRDGYTDATLPNAVKTQCAFPGVGYYREDSTHIKGISGDCDDNDLNVIGIDWYLDADGDGYVDETLPDAVKSGCTTPGVDYYLEANLQAITGDCNDDAADPKAVHMNPASVWYLDADGDGYGSDKVSTQVSGVCNRPGANLYLAFEMLPGRVNTDCDDDPASDYSRWVNPGQPEVCNTPDIDDNCDGLFAGGYETEKAISSGSAYGSPPKISETKVVWSSKLTGENAFKIRVYDIAADSVVNSLNGGVNGAVAPHISESENVVWTEYNDVFLFKNGVAGVTKIYDGVDTVGQEDMIGASGARVNDLGSVTWEVESFLELVDDEPVYQYDVYLKPFGAAVNKITLTPHAMSLLPKIIGNGNVVFSNNQVYMYRASSLSTVLLSTGFSSASGSDVNDAGKVVWSGRLAGDNSEIYLYDSVLGGTPVALTSTSSTMRNSEPEINSVGDVVWQTWNGTNSEVYVRYAGTSTNVRVTDTTYNNLNPKINDDGVMVWQAFYSTVGGVNNGDSEVFICKGDRPPLPSSAPNEVCDGGNLPFHTDNAYGDSSPSINLTGDVVWKRNITTQNIKICLKRYIACVAGNTYYKDADGDGYGNFARYIEIADTVVPVGYVTNGDDCDDADPLVFQGCGASPKINLTQGDRMSNGYFVIDVPSIRSEDSQGVISEASIRITATITDDGKVNASLYYRTSPSGSLTEVSMVSVGNGQFVADIPLDASASQIEYFVMAVDEEGNEANTSKPAAADVVEPPSTPTLGEWGVVLMLSMFLVVTYKKLGLKDC